jgi:hypothetical protein
MSITTRTANEKRVKMVLSHRASSSVYLYINIHAAKIVSERASLLSSVMSKEDAALASYVQQVRASLVTVFQGVGFHYNRNWEWYFTVHLHTGERLDE